MGTVITVLIVLLFDWGLGSLMAYYKKKRLEKEEDVFYLDLEAILRDSRLLLTTKIDNAQRLCRRTPGKAAAAAYSTLSFLNNPE